MSVPRAHQTRFDRAAAAVGGRTSRTGRAALMDKIIEELGLRDEGAAVEAVVVAIDDDRRSLANDARQHLAALNDDEDVKNLLQLDRDERSQARQRRQAAAPPGWCAFCFSLGAIWHNVVRARPSI